MINFKYYKNNVNSELNLYLNLKAWEHIAIFIGTFVLGIFEAKNPDIGYQ